MTRILVAIFAFMLSAPAAHAQSLTWASNCQMLGERLGVPLIPNMADPEKCKRDADSGNPDRSGNPNPNAMEYDRFLEALYRDFGVPARRVIGGRVVTVTTLPEAVIDEKAPIFRAYMDRRSQGLLQEGMVIAPSQLMVHRPVLPQDGIRTVNLGAVRTARPDK